MADAIKKFLSEAFKFKAETTKKEVIVGLCTYCLMLILIDIFYYFGIWYSEQLYDFELQNLEYTILTSKIAAIVTVFYLYLFICHLANFSRFLYLRGKNRSILILFAPSLLLGFPVFVFQSFGVVMGILLLSNNRQNTPPL